jgi:hypothetical protein
VDLSAARPFYRSWGAGVLVLRVLYAVFLGAQGRAFRVVTMYSAPQAINASGGFARCEYASQIRLGRVKIHCISLDWRAYSLRRQSNHHVREREPSTHTPILCPVPRPTRLSHANAKCGQTQHPVQLRAVLRSIFTASEAP